MQVPDSAPISVMSAITIQVSSNGNVVVTPGGPYNQVIRNTIYQTVPSAVWVGARRRWEAPATAATVAHLANAAAILARHGVRSFFGNLKAVTLPQWEGRYDDLPNEDARPTKPWRHQRGAYWFLNWAYTRLGSALLDCGMRTGKTRMVLEFLASLEDRRALIVTPTSVVTVWSEQSEKHVTDGELNVVPLDDGSVSDRVDAIIELMNSSSQKAVAVVGWSVIERLSTEQKTKLRDALRGKVIVADEVHFAKSAGSARSKNLAFISTRAAMKIGASGTPLAHSPLDAYGIFRFLDPGVFGRSFQRFRDQYAVMKVNPMGYPQVVGYRDLDRLSGWMGPYTYRATRDVLDLPDAVHVDVMVKLPPTAATIYQSLRNEAVADIASGTLVAANSLSRLVRLAQVASGHLPRVGGDGIETIHHEKKRALVDLFNSCDPKEPWVVFSRFHHDLDVTRAAAEVSDRPVMELSGRAREIDAWRLACADGVGPVLAAQIQSGGIGISLVEAAFVAYLSIGYSLAEYEQSLARCHGPEQTRPVGYYHVIARGTVDVDIRRALAKRKDVLESVFESMRSNG